MPAPIQIKRSDVVADLRELSALTGLSLTDAIARAAKTQLALARISHQLLAKGRSSWHN
jgi:hypothetical protein